MRAGARSSSHELAEVPDVDVLLLLHIRAGRRAVVRPPLHLEQELRDHWHHGQPRDRAHALRGDLRDAEDAGDEDVDFAVD